METVDISDIKLFSEYIKDNKHFSDDELHIPYLIGSPIKLFKDNSFSKKNNALLPVVLLIKKANGELVFEETAFAWKSIDLVQTYTKIDNTGKLISLGELPEYQSLFDETKIDVELEQVSEISLESVVGKYGFYSKLPGSIVNKFKNERFLLIRQEDKNYIIPVVEVIRFFYCLSASDSLKQAIFHPSGMKLLVEKCTKKLSKYNLYLKSLCKIDDYKKILYFIHDGDFLEMFHFVFYCYKRDNILSACFPFKKEFSMLCRILKTSKESNNFLISKILDSDMLNNFFTKNNIELHVHHPQSQKKEQYTGKRNSDHDKKRRIPINGNDVDYNDSLSSAASIPTQVITEENVNYFPEEKVVGKIERTRQREERGGITSIVPVEVKRLSAGEGKNTADFSVQHAETSNRKSEIIDYPEPIKSTETKVSNDIKEFIEKLTEEGFEVVTCATYDFPNKIDGQKKAISYIDDAMKIKRKYTVLVMRKSPYRYHYIDVESSGKHKRKEILVLINQDISMAHRCIYQQVHYGNHKWLNRETMGLAEGVDYVRARHNMEHERLIEKFYGKT